MEELDALCERHTGRSLQDWDRKHRETRQRAAAIRAIRSDKPLSHHQVKEWIWKYGFQPHDFRCCMVDCSAVRNFDPSFQAPMNKRTGTQARTVIRWFLKPELVPA